MQLNQCTFLGHLGNDATTTALKSGKNAVGLSIAVNTGSGDYKRTVWVSVKIYGNDAEWLSDTANLPRKGDKAIVTNAEYRVDEVPPENNSDADVKRYHYFVVSGFGSSIMIIPKAHTEATEATATAEESKPAIDDDLPF